MRNILCTHNVTDGWADTGVKQYGPIQRLSFSLLLYIIISFVFHLLVCTYTYTRPLFLSFRFVISGPFIAFYVI